MGVGMFCGIFPSIGHTVFGDLKFCEGSELVEAPSSDMRRAMPPRPASNSVGWERDVVASRIKRNKNSMKDIVELLEQYNNC